MRRRRLDRGGVFITTLIVLTGLVAIVASYAASQRVSFQAKQNRVDKMRAEQMADSGIQRALAQIALIDSTATTTKQDEWATLGTTGSDRFLVSDGSFRLEIVDASARVDINTATQEHLSRLPLTSEQVDCLLDWRSPELTPRPEGAKDEYYSNLPIPYNTALRPFFTVDELLQVRGFTPATLYEQAEVNNSNQFLVQGSVEDQPLLIDLIMVGQLSRNTGAGGQNMVNANTASAQQLAQILGNQPLANQIVQNRPYTNLQDLLTRNNVTTQSVGPILDGVTVSTLQQIGGRVNLNTASEAVLNSLPGMTPDVSQAIIQRQDSGMTALSEVASIPGMTIEILRQIADLITLNSQTFLIRVIGTYGSAQVTKEVFVEITTEGPRIRRMDTPEGENLLTRWGWQQEPSNDIDLSGGGLGG